MYDSSQELVLDHLLRFGQIPLAVLEAKAESEPAADGIQQGQRYAERLGLRFTIASNGHDYIFGGPRDGRALHVTHATHARRNPPASRLRHQLGQVAIRLFLPLAH